MLQSQLRILIRKLRSKRVEDRRPCYVRSIHNTPKSDPHQHIDYNLEINLGYKHFKNYTQQEIGNLILNPALNISEYRENVYNCFPE